MGNNLPVPILIILIEGPLTDRSVPEVDNGNADRPEDHGAQDKSVNLPFSREKPKQCAAKNHYLQVVRDGTHDRREITVLATFRMIVGREHSHSPKYLTAAAPVPFLKL